LIAIEVLKKSRVEAHSISAREFSFGNPGLACSDPFRRSPA